MNWESLQQQSENIHAQMKELDKLKEKKEVIEKQLRNVRIDISKYEDDLSKMKIQLIKSEKHSFIDSIRHFWSKYDAMEQEKLAAIKELKLNESYALAEKFSQQLIEIQQQIAVLDESMLHDSLDQNILAKKDWLRINEKEQVNEIERIDNEKQLLISLLKEIDDALEAGKNAYQACLHALEEMKKAKDLSSLDLLGGGLMATKMKYDQLKDTTYYIHHAQMALQNFKNELLDVEELKLNDVEVKSNALIKFSDFFMDDLFSALKVHDQINDAFSKLQRIIDDISATLEKLKGKRYIVTTELRKIEKQMEQYLF